MDVHTLIEEQIKPQIKQPIWDSWYIKERIGSGGFSCVYRVEARRTSMVDEAALKVSAIVADRPFGTEEGKRSFIEKQKALVDNESVIMKKLHNCPYIVSYFDEKMEPFYVNGSFEGYYSLIRMELLTPLTTVMQEKRFSYSEENVRKLACEIGQALHYAHERDVIHRDVKPENLFVSKEKVYKLGDFNVSKRGGSAHSVAGSPGYMAPEIFRAKSDPDAYYTEQADIYSLGICLYQMMNEGYFPLEDPGIGEEDAVTRRQQGETFPKPKHGSEDFKRIIMKACAFEPKDRYANMKDMLADLGIIVPNIRDAEKTKKQPYNPHETEYAGTGENVENQPFPKEPVRKQEPPSSQRPVTEKPKKEMGFVAIVAVIFCLAVIAGAAITYLSRLPVEEPSKPTSHGFVNSEQAEYVSLYAEADDEATEKARLYSGEELEIYALEGNWYHVKYGEIEGYIKVPYVTFVVPSEPTYDTNISESETTTPENTSSETIVTTAPPPTERPVELDQNSVAIPTSYSNYMPYSSATSGYCAVDGCNFYKYAALNTSTWGEAFKLYERDAVTIWGECNGFYYITVYGGSGFDIPGYVPVSSIVIGTAPRLEEIYYTASEGYVSVTSSYVRSTKTKFIDSNIVATLCKGTVFTINSFDGFWYSINYAGKTGYISYKMITPGASPDKISPMTGYVSSDGCNVRYSPSKDNNSNIVGTLSKGATFTATHFDGYWYYVTYPGGNGYVSHKMVSFGTAPAPAASVDVYPCEIYGEIKGKGVAGFTTSYVVENGAKTMVRETLGDRWHIKAVRYCYSMGITWYEVYDSDDGDYYGWVDSNYLTLYVG